MRRRPSLKDVEEEVANCRECRKGKFGRLVFGEGNPKAKVMFVGEAPGSGEAIAGRPFVGRAGKFLDKLLASVGISRKDVYLTSPVKYYPGKRRLSKDEVLHGRTHLLKQIDAVNPRLVVAMGKTALLALFQRDFKLEDVHGRILRADGRTFFPTFHPAAAMRFPEIRKLMERDFRKLKRIVDIL
jgi:uracil-DNA glycosylase family 4